MALPTLFDAASMRAICAFNFIETAKPALSSAGEVIFEPDDNRASDWLNLVEDCMSSVALPCADRFVLITITNSFRESPREGHLICATSMSRVLQLKGETPFSPPAFLAAGRHVLRQPLHRKVPSTLETFFYSRSFFLPPRNFSATVFLLP